MSDAERPQRGLSPWKALRTFSDREDLKRWLEHASYDEQAALFGNERLPAWTPRRGEWKHWWDKLQLALDAKLQRGELVASGIAHGGSRREVIEPSLWEVLQIDYEFEEFVGGGHHFLKPEIFDPRAIPLNIRDVPEWLVPRPPRFKAEADYRHVFLDGQKYHLGPVQAAFVKALHEASVTPDPWCSGKALLNRIDAASTRVSDLFKSENRAIIESDGRGLYRLNIFH